MNPDCSVWYTHASLFQNRCRILKNILLNAGTAFLGTVTKKNNMKNVQMQI